MLLGRVKYKDDYSNVLVNLADGYVQFIEGNFYEPNFKVNVKHVEIDNVQFLPPVTPTKIIALGYNYKDLVGEKDCYDEPVVFLKPTSSIIGNNDHIKIPANSKVWTEVELAIIVRKKACCICINEADNHILGYTVANDVTTTNILNRDHHLARSKGWDTFCPVGNFVITDVDTKDLKMTNHINGVLMQNSTTKNRIMNDKEIVSFVSKIMTLFPGDIILTGTPAKAEDSVITDGDIVKVAIEGIGSVVNYVVNKK
jgi:2-keto-4-pentenoate hydratase/2-oxohepta-3-ene-1,7-dioic acid hydratase in catechol pathway